MFQSTSATWIVYKLEEVIPLSVLILYLPKGRSFNL